MGESPFDIAGTMAADAEPGQSTRIILVDDHPLVRSGLRVLIELESDLVVMGEAETATDAVEMVEAEPPDLVLMDVRLPDRSGVSACHEITTRFPGVKVLILTAYADEVALAGSLNARASGYVLKSVRAGDLIADIRRVTEGEVVFDQLGEGFQTRHLLANLSPQERVVAVNLAEGMTNREIAVRMNLAEKTVKNYVSNMLMKLGMARRSEAAAYVSRVQAMAGYPLAAEPRHQA